MVMGRVGSMELRLSGVEEVNDVLLRWEQWTCRVCDTNLVQLGNITFACDAFGRRFLCKSNCALSKKGDTGN